MPYADRLADTAAWYCQMWAESLGKHKEGLRLGPTPLAARGATDQHSLLQLFRDGPLDKFVMFVEVKKRRHLEIPRVFASVKSCDYLAGRAIGDLISSQLRGTRCSLSLAGVPTLTIILDEPGAAAAASLMVLFEVAAAIAGFLYDIDPFDQPGVEESKKFARALMGQKGLEKIREEIEEANGSRKRWIVSL